MTKTEQYLVLFFAGILPIVLSTVAVILPIVMGAGLCIFSACELQVLTLDENTNVNLKFSVPVRRTQH